MWQDWINGILGLALFVLAFVGITGSAVTWTLALGGILVAVLGFWGANARLRKV